MLLEAADGTTGELVRALDASLAEFTQVIGTAAETAWLAPFRWRAQDRVRRYLRVADRIGGVVRNLRVLTRRSLLLLNRGVNGQSFFPVGGLTADRTPEGAHVEALRACRQTADVQEGLSITGQVIVAQIRSTAVDLLRSAGLSYVDADTAVRAAVTKPRLRRDQAL